MRRDAVNCRRGFTLIELLVAISLLAVIIPLSGWTIYLLLRAQTATADSLVDGMILSRFAAAFRDDVHAARSADVISSGTPAAESIRLRLDSPRVISYTSGAAGVIVRTVERGTLIERREEFRLAGTQTRFERDANGSTLAAVHRLRNLTVGGGPIAASSGSFIRIEAVIGRDRRFERVAAAASKETPPPTVPPRPAKKGNRS
jgi:prepilin-type N-terminal cleavage/methylation domain-containing protein